MNPDPSSRLPNEILDQLEYSEIPDTLKVWELSEAYYSDEPSSQQLTQLTEGMWPSIDQATTFRLLHLVTWPRVAALAACIALLLSIGIVLTQQPVSVIAPFGEQISYELPDGSSVRLNSGTYIEFSRNFGQETRDLTLHRGEIFLNVEESSIPFTVASFDAITEVLGTSFNIRSWPDESDASTEVTVESGQVRFGSIIDPLSSVTLTAGTTAQIHPDGLKPIVLQVPDGPLNYNWIDGGFKFSSQSLGNIVKEIERRYAIEITIDSPELASMSIGILKQSPESAEEILQDICALDCELRAVLGGYLLTSR